MARNDCFLLALLNYQSISLITDEITVRKGGLFLLSAPKDKTTIPHTEVFAALGSREDVSASPEESERNF